MEIEELSNKKICVVGLGKSGLAVIKKLSGLGAQLCASESKPLNGIPAGTADFLRTLNVPLETGGHTPEFLSGCDLIVVSPGVHLDDAAVEGASAKGIPVISEIELAFGFLTKPVIAVTGTNGKTTTTTLIGRMLEKAGYKAAVAGNIGEPLINVDDTKYDFVVAEVSSYQLETVLKFKPHVSVILNLTPDHLARHKTMENYSAAKGRIFANQTMQDALVYNAKDPLVEALAKQARCQKIPFGQGVISEKGAFVNEGYLCRLRGNFVDAVCPVSAIKLRGSHNLENCLAASSACLALDVPKEAIASVLMEFAGVEHRIETAGVINGVEFVNDSKATNPDSTQAALKALAGKKNIVIILGGRDKGVDLAQMCRLIKAEAKAAVLIGEAASRFEEALLKEGFNTIRRASSLDEAVKQGFSLSQPGDVVLLSPACASFDMFDDYEHRGRAFKEAVKRMEDASEG